MTSEGRTLTGTLRVGTVGSFIVDKVTITLIGRAPQGSFIPGRSGPVQIMGTTPQTIPPHTGAPLRAMATREEGGTLGDTGIICSLLTISYHTSHYRAGQNFLGLNFQTPTWSLAQNITMHKVWES